MICVKFTAFCDLRMRLAAIRKSVLNLAEGIKPVNPAEAVEHDVISIFNDFLSTHSGFSGNCWENQCSSIRGCSSTTANIVFLVLISPLRLLTKLLLLPLPQMPYCSWFYQLRLASAWCVNTNALYLVLSRSWETLTGWQSRLDDGTNQWSYETICGEICFVWLGCSWLLVIGSAFWQRRPLTILWLTISILRFLAYAVVCSLWFNVWCVAYGAWFAIYMHSVYSS